MIRSEGKSMLNVNIGRSWYVLLAAILVLNVSPCYAGRPGGNAGGAAQGGKMLWLSSMPTMQHEGKATGKRGGRPAGGGAGGAHQQRGGGHESEHRPQSTRTYWLNTCAISDEAKAFVVRPEGAVEPVPIERDGHEVRVNVNTPLGEGPVHGANNIYLIDSFVEDGVLIMSAAKWLAIHHNCGWGHDHRFNKVRMTSLSFSDAPLEIVVDNLWDKNFHSNIMSGDQILVKVLSFGKPAAGAIVDIESEQGWRKQIVTDGEGKGSFRMVRDYYPDSWLEFDRTRSSRMKMSARYENGEGGEFRGQAYNGVRMTSTFTWRYYPARQEYVAYDKGLMIAFFTMTVCGLGIFCYRERRKKTYREIRFDEKNS